MQSSPHAPDDFWVFAYGSLMWNPEFPHVDAHLARLHGFHRALCLWSFDYRGTPERPGLVLGLDYGGSCLGKAYRIHGRDREAVVRYLDKRETSNGEYNARWLPVRLTDGKAVTALAYVVNPGNRWYAGKLGLHRTVELVLQGHGDRGACLDYVRNTVAHLKELGIRDRALETILKAAEG